VLPAATTAALFEVTATRHHAIRRGVLDRDEVGLDVAAMDLAHFRAYDLARACPGHENCQSVDSAHAFSTVGQTVDRYDQFVARPWACATC
jgi:hypothetical protein